MDNNTIMLIIKFITHTNELFYFIDDTSLYIVYISHAKKSISV